MPINLPAGLPAAQLLDGAQIFALPQERAERQDIRPLEIGLLNLMPNKLNTEAQIARVLSNTPLQVNLTLVTTASYQPQNVSEAHLTNFYVTWEDIRERHFDGFIVTGAPVELLEWTEVAYWDELTQIFDWQREHVHSSLFICWGAQAALFHYYGIPKYRLEEKCHGVFRQRVKTTGSPLQRAFDDEFWVPVSRETETRRGDIARHPALRIESESEESGVSVVYDTDHHQVFSFNHPEYDSGSLGQEFLRDQAAGIARKLPQNYFPGDDPNRTPSVSWRAHGQLFYSNWLNLCVYQDISFDSTTTGERT